MRNLVNFSSFDTFGYSSFEYKLFKCVYLSLGITVAAWVRLLELPGSHSIFDTIGNSHECGQYHFEVNDGNVRWFHRNETQNTVFSVEATGGVVKQGMQLILYVHIS